jgi:hypothetical protein
MVEFSLIPKLIYLEASYSYYGRLLEVSNEIQLISIKIIMYSCYRESVKKK